MKACTKVGPRSSKKSIQRCYVYRGVYIYVFKLRYVISRQPSHYIVVGRAHVFRLSTKNYCHTVNIFHRAGKGILLCHYTAKMPRTSQTNLCQVTFPVSRLKALIVLLFSLDYLLSSLKM